MKPIVKLAAVQMSDGGEMALYRRDSDFTIKIDRQDLMQSRQHESELELARLGCAHLKRHENPRILVGGLGMGYTLSEALNIAGPTARVVVVELFDAVVKWNREFLGDLNGQPLNDERVDIKRCDAIDLISGSKNTFDAILLDIDNGPRAMTHAGNKRLYGPDGIMACRHALRTEGCLAVWSAEPNKKFERLLMYCGLQLRRYRVPAYKGAKSQWRFVWVAAEDEKILPPGGGEPQPPQKAGRPAGRGAKRFRSSRRHPIVHSTR